ncbi:MAG: hypothetical protein ACKV1O_21470 [Saprospiraceae bacterium]
MGDKEPFMLESGELLEPGSGYSLRVLPKYYIVGGYLQGLAIGPMWRKREYSIKGSDGKIGITDLCLVVSYQLQLRKWIWLDYYLGIGPRTFQLPEGMTHAQGTARFITPWGIKLGYSF